MQTETQPAFTRLVIPTHSVRDRLLLSPYSLTSALTASLTGIDQTSLSSPSSSVKASTYLQPPAIQPSTTPHLYSAATSNLEPQPSAPQPTTKLNNLIILLPFLFQPPPTPDKDNAEMTTIAADISAMEAWIDTLTPTNYNTPPIVNNDMATKSDVTCNDCNAKMQWCIDDRRRGGNTQIHAWRFCLRDTMPWNQWVLS
ncbi:hypothetical protein K458DRAFT_410091 [Lentithecium fluviatile CBS 122367]|uniref:Uncharacterized protein n=1 Tax=Lentithecium fluviatile CBS 122367 TaxID=1168545 RepID=A0A6G1IFA3_9PLEO|nr:hypothetical protein K458DRAFT_410091 [Lentithecium fluviatile CBS 122367]